MRSEAWRPAAAARNRWSREAREVALQALRPGCEELAVTAPAQMPVREARPREPKPATVERREASVPRYGTQGASLGAWRAALCARLTGVPPSTRTFLGAPPTPHSGERSKRCKSPGAENAPRERDGLFDMVNCEVRDARPHPEERACRRRSANSNLRTRVSKDEDEQVHSPSCFETHRSATMLGRRRARSRSDAPQHEGRGRTAHFGEAKPLGSMPADPCEADLRLQEAIAGPDPLFPDCYLQ